MALVLGRVVPMVLVVPMVSVVWEVTELVAAVAASSDDVEPAAADGVTGEHSNVVRMSPPS